MKLVNPTPQIGPTRLANDALEATIFTTNGNFIPQATADYIIDATGGGAGGSGGGGSSTTAGGSGGFGGGAGERRFTKISLTAGTSYAVVIGTGGANSAGAPASGDSVASTAGNNTTFNASIVALGGVAARGQFGANINRTVGTSGQNGEGQGGGQGGLAAAGNTPGGNASAPNGNSGAGGGGGGGGSTGGTAQAGGNGTTGANGMLTIWRA